MGGKRRNGKNKSSSSEDDDDSDSEESEESEIDRKKQAKRKSSLRNISIKPFSKKNTPDLQVKKRVQIMENEIEDHPQQKLRSQYRKPTSVNKSRKTLDEDEKEMNEEQIFNIDSDDDDFNLVQNRRNGEGRRKGPNKTIIATQNLETLKIKAKQLDEQNMIIENLEQQLEQKQKQVMSLNLEQQQDKQEKDKDIQNLANQKKLLENKVGLQSKHLKRVKEELNLRRGSLLNLQLERRNSEENENETQQTSSQTFDLANIPLEIQLRASKRPSIFSKLINYMRYNYPMSNYVHRILNYYTKNEEIHFTYISVYFNLSLIFFALYSPLIIFQIFSNKQNFDSSKPFSFTMYHEFDSQKATILIVAFLAFILINGLILFHRVSYVRKKDVESEAQSLKDLNNFKLIFSSINFRLSNYEFMKKQQFALKERVLLSWRQMDKYISMRQSYGHWIFLLRIIFFSVQIIVLIGMLYILQYINKLDQFSKSGSLQFKMPLVQSMISVIISHFVSKIFYYLTYCELWDSYGISFSYRIWKSYLVYITGIFYTCLLKSPLYFEGADLQYLGLNENFYFFTSDFNCETEQLVYSLLAIYICFIIWNSLIMVMPNLLNLLKRSNPNDSKSKILKNCIPFRVLEETSPIIILNMIVNLIVPLFPLIALINTFTQGFIFAFNWQVIIKLRYQQYSSISRQFIMGTLVKFYLIQNLLSLIYYAIMSYQNQSSYFSSFEYTSKNIKRICGPLGTNETIATSISNNLDSLDYINQLFVLISWQPLLWLVIIVLFTLSRLETKTKDVWRREYFIKSKEMQTIKNFFQKQAQQYEDKIKYAAKQLSSLDTPTNLQQSQQQFGRVIDFSSSVQPKSKFALQENNSSHFRISSNQIGNVGNLSINLHEVPHSPSLNQGLDETKSSLLSRQNLVSQNLVSNNSNNFFKQSGINNISRFKPI